MMPRDTDAQWNGCPSGKVTQYKKIYLALGACPMSQPVNMMPNWWILTSTKITMDPLEFDGERDLEGTTVLIWLNTWPPEMSNSEYGRKEKRLNLWDIEKIKKLMSDLKKFVYVLP